MIKHESGCDFEHNYDTYIYHNISSGGVSILVNDREISIVEYDKFHTNNIKRFRTKLNFCPSCGVKLK